MAVTFRAPSSTKCACHARGSLLTFAMKMTLLLIVLLAVWVTSCDRGTSVHRADAALAADLPLGAKNIGVSRLEDRKIDLEDFEVTLTNRTSAAVFLSCSTPKLHSAYITDRNPKAICYDISPERGSSHLSSRSLSGSGSAIPLKPGQSLSFVAPIPILAGDDEGGEFKVSLTVYLDEGFHEGRIVYTDVLTHNRKGESGRGDRIAPVTPPTPPGMRL